MRASCTIATGNFATRALVAATVITGALCAQFVRAAPAPPAAPPLAPPTTHDDIGRWVVDSIVGPMDGQRWHTAFYLQGIRDLPLVRRHSGLMLRCTPADIRRRVVLTFAFGEVLKTNQHGDIEVVAQIDDAPPNRLQLLTGNQTNAEFPNLGAYPFAQRLAQGERLQARVRLSPRGTATLDVPLAAGRTAIKQIFERCGIRLTPAPSAAATLNTPDSTPATTPAARTANPDLLRYLHATTTAERDEARAALVRSEPDFPRLLRALQQPLPLGSGSNATGKTSHSIAGVTYPYYLQLPRSYRPAGPALPLIVSLHGGVNRGAWRARERWWSDRSWAADAIVLAPASWRDAHWWSPQQTTSITHLIAHAKRHYHVDPNRVYVVGVSDGGGGALYLGTTAATAIAGIVSIIGHPGVLFEPRVNTGPAPALANLANRPVLMINGADDPLFPVATLTPWITRLQSLGVTLTSLVQPDTGHRVRRDTEFNRHLDDFLQHQQREPHPTQLYWETDAALRFPRYAWLRIDALHADQTRGCVSATRTGGRFVLRTAGVAQLTLLVPSLLAGAPLQVELNDEPSARLSSAGNPATLLRWHARDADRTQLYAREHQLQPAGETADVCKPSGS